MTRHPLYQLVLSRTREFYREPEAVFWVYVVPVLLALGLGVAFRNRPVERILIDVERGPGAAAVVAALERDTKFVVRVEDRDSARLRLRTGKTALVVMAHDTSVPAYEYLFDPTRPESVLARAAVDDALQRASGRRDPAAVSDVAFQEPGARYIDFLIPGLLGMNLMGGGLWGIGFVIVDMRIRKLLKRLIATPMRKSDFLLGLMISRMLFMIPEVVLLVVVARLVFGVVIHGSVVAVIALIGIGALTFAGLGLLVASRARTLEAVSGLMNMVMLPMWLLSGIFFSSDRFPAVVQPLIRLLPLTPLIDALRAVMLEGASLASQSLRVAILVGYALVTFALALAWFRWK